MAAAAVTHSQTQSRVHSASCIKDGKVICACDKPAVRRVSRTSRNPERPFYCCEADRCGFWKWEDKIPLSETQNSQANKGVTTDPMTPQKALPSTYPLSPPETQAHSKRTFTTMQDGVGSSADMGRRPSEMWSAEARARRIAIMEAAQREKNAEEENSLETQREIKEESQEGRYVLKSPPPRSGSYVRPSTIPLDSDGTEEAEQNQEGEGEVLLGRRAAKRPRFRSSQLQLPSTPTRVLTISQSYQLPTPNTSEREVSEAMFMHEGADTVPPSPTSFTKAGQRAAMERERTSANGRADEPDLFTSTRRSSPSSVGARHLNHNSQASGSFAVQLGSVIANAHGNSGTSRAASQRSQSQSSTALAQATSDDFPSLLRDLQTRWEKTRSEKEEWQRRAVDAERKVAGLERENNEWKQKFSRLEELFGKIMEPSTPAPTPPRRSN